MLFTNDVDDTPFTFGKFKGKTPDEVSEIKPDYLTWMAKTWHKDGKTIPFSEGLHNYCLAEERKKGNNHED